MNKKLAFSPSLISMIMSKKKYSTWRLFDNKKLLKNDIFDLINSDTRKKFATAKIVKIIQKQFGELTKSDKEGHEFFKSEKEMYKTYSKYYHKKIDKNSIVKIIFFKLFKNK
jgi:hypothetical protein